MPAGGHPRLALPRNLPRPSIPAFLRGPRLQVANLAVFFTVAYLTVDFPNPPEKVAASVALAVVLEAAVVRLREGDLGVPWGAIIGTAAAWLVLDGVTWLPFLVLPALVVFARQFVRWRGRNLFNANNLAMSALLVAGVVRVGVNDWGAAPQVVGLIVLFGSISTSRVNRLDLAAMYLGFSALVYFAVATSLGWGLPTVWLWALSPLQVMIGFFAVTDPATSPGSDRWAKAAYALFVVLLGVPATVAGFVEAPIFALLAAAPQRHLVVGGVERVKAAVRERRRPSPAGGGLP